VIRKSTHDDIRDRYNAASRAVR